MGRVPCDFFVVSILFHYCVPIPRIRNSPIQHVNDRALHGAAALQTSAVCTSAYPIHQLTLVGSRWAEGKE